MMMLHKALFSFLWLITLSLCSKIHRLNLKRKAPPTIISTIEHPKSCHRVILKTFLKPIKLPSDITLEQFSPNRALLLYKKMKEDDIKKDLKHNELASRIKIVSNHRSNSNLSYIFSFDDHKVTKRNKYSYNINIARMLQDFNPQKEVPALISIESVKDSSNCSFEEMLFDKDSLPEHDLSIHIRTPSLCDKIKQSYVKEPSKHPLHVDHKYYAYSKDAKHLGTFTGSTLEDENSLTETYIKKQVIVIKRTITQSVSIKYIVPIEDETLTYFDCLALKDGTILLFGYIHSQVYETPGELFTSQVVFSDASGVIDQTKTLPFGI